jgi:hypothetical protein
LNCKPEQIEDILEKYEGKELELLQKLHRKYNAVDILVPGEEADTEEAYPSAQKWKTVASIEADAIRDKIRSQGGIGSVVPFSTEAEELRSPHLFIRKMFSLTPSNTKRARAAQASQAAASFARVREHNFCWCT